MSRIERVMLEKERDQEEEDGGAIIAFNKESLYKTLPVEEKGNELDFDLFFVAFEIMYTIE